MVRGNAGSTVLRLSLQSRCHCAGLDGLARFWEFPASPPSCRRRLRGVENSQGHATPYSGPSGLSSRAGRPRRSGAQVCFARGVAVLRRQLPVKSSLTNDAVAPGARRDAIPGTLLTRECCGEPRNLAWGPQPGGCWSGNPTAKIIPRKAGTPLHSDAPARTYKRSNSASYFTWLKCYLSS